MSASASAATILPPSPVSALPPADSVAQGAFSRLLFAGHGGRLSLHATPAVLRAELVGFGAMLTGRAVAVFASCPVQRERMRGWLRGIGAIQTEQLTAAEVVVLWLAPGETGPMRRLPGAERLLLVLSEAEPLFSADEATPAPGTTRLAARQVAAPLETHQKRVRPGAPAASTTLPMRVAHWVQDLARSVLKA